jgi:hypothetical protein
MTIRDRSEEDLRYFSGTLNRGHAQGGLSAILLYMVVIHSLSLHLKLQPLVPILLANNAETNHGRRRQNMLDCEVVCVIPCY